MTQTTLTVLYDGGCPLCAWEKHHLMRCNRQGLLGFIDIQSPEFDATLYGISMQTLMGRLHGITADGRFLVGVDALIASYRAVGWWWAYLPLTIAPRSWVELAYGWFADHRHGLSRRFGRWFGGACDTGRCHR